MAASDLIQKDHYWVNAPPLEVASRYFELIGGPNSASLGTQSFININQLRAHRHYYGSLPSWGLWNMPSSSYVGQSGDQGSNTDIRVNWLHSNVDAKHQIITAPALSWSCTATNTDSQSQADATRGAEILEYFWKQNGYQQQAKSAVLGAILYGEEFLYTYWNPLKGEQLAFDAEQNQIHFQGDIEVINVPSWDVYRDITARSFDQSNWFGIRILVSRWDLIAQYPQYKDLILAAEPPPVNVAGGLVGIPTAALTNSDRIAVHHFYHKRTPAMPLGLQAIFVSDKLCLSFQALEPCYFHIPLHRMWVGEYKGTAFPYSSLWETMGLQDIATDIQGALATNIVTFGRQMIAAVKDEDLDVDSIGNGPAVLYYRQGSTPPQGINFLQSGEEHFKHLDRLRGDMREIMGLNDVALGQSPTATPNAQAWALLSSAALTANSDAQANFIKMITNAGRSILNIFKAKADQPRKLALTGVHGPNPELPREFDKGAFTGIDDVMVEAASALSQTAAGRLQLADMYSQKGFVQTPEQLQAVVETGRLEPLTQSLTDELVFIAAENEQLLKGQSLSVAITDSHQMHIREHKAVASNMAARMDPSIMAALDEHIRQHMQMLLSTDPRILAILGQASPPPEMPGQTPMNNPFEAQAPLSAPSKPGQPGTKALVNRAMQPPDQSQPGRQLPQVSSIKAPVNPATGQSVGPPGVPGPKVK